MMKITVLTEYLDFLFHIDLYKRSDYSFLKRIQCVPDSIRFEFVPTFFERCNGLMLKNSDMVSTVIVSCFLSDDVIDALRAKQLGNALLICHHMFDIDSGLPGLWNARGFLMISSESFFYLKNNGISVYILHLPLDANNSIINTHLSLCRCLRLRPERDLLYREGYTMGYLVAPNLQWLSAADDYFFSKLIFGNLVERLSSPDFVAVLAGMVSSIATLEEIASSGCSYLLCGDVILRQRTKRAEEIFQWLMTTPIPIVCFSHKESEEPAMKELLKHIQQRFPGLSTLFLKGTLQWK